MKGDIITLLECLGCLVSENENMALHTTFKTGGKADIFCTCSNIYCARKAYMLLYDSGIPFTVIGKGSNILVSDSGYRGVILMFSGDRYIADCGNGLFLLSGGAAASRIIGDLIKKGYTGAEFAAAIPGTVGGHITMNAGCCGRQMSDITLRVNAVIEGQKRTLNKKECLFNYRNSLFLQKKCIILSALLKLKKGGEFYAIQKYSELAKLRAKTQPNLPSAGSVFKRQGKNLEIIPAKLIEQAGLKGFNIKGAQVSTRHSGFIVNTGNATSYDVYCLIKKIKTDIHKQYGVLLTEEIKYIGEF